MPLWSTHLALLGRNPFYLRGKHGTTAHANTIAFDTFGPMNSYNSSSGYAVSQNPTFLEAARFTPTASGNITLIELGITWSVTTPDRLPPLLLPVQVFLYADAVGTPDVLSQTLLGTATPTMQFDTTGNSVIGFMPDSAVAILSGTPYWLVLKPDGPSDASGQTNWNESLGSAGPIWFSEGNDVWEPIPQATNLPAFRLTVGGVGAGVPDGGSTVLLFGSSLAALVIIRSRLRPVAALASRRQRLHHS